MWKRERNIDPHHFAISMSQFFTLTCILLVAIDVQKLSVLAVFRPPETAGSHSPGSDIETKELIPENLKAVVTCTLGKPHRKFDECRCGEYAIVVPEKDIPPENLPEYHVMTVIRRYKRDRKVYYFCSFCSLCPDGIRTSNNCTQHHDTQCSSGECIDPTFVFDIGRKACIKDPSLLVITSSPTTLHGEDGSAEHSTQTTQNLNHMDVLSEPQEVNEKNISAQLLLDESVLTGIVVLVLFMVVILIVNVKTCIYFRQQRQKSPDQKGMTSSASKETMTDV